MKDIIKKDPYYKPGDYIGKLGIEEAYEKELRGTRGVKIYLVDVFSRIKGHMQMDRMDTVAVQGIGYYRQLILIFRNMAKSLMKNKRGSIVAIEPSDRGDSFSCIFAEL